MSIGWMWFFSVMAGIMLFLHGLSAFSEEVARLGGDRLREVMRRITRTDARGVLLGAFATAIVQSSTAIISMAIGLAHNRTLNARSTFMVILGANVGTTLTPWLLAFKITGLGPIFVTVGGFWSLLGPSAWRPYGKPLFYFGLIFLALELITEVLVPMANHPAFEEWRNTLDSPLIALLFGALLTVIVQSSTVVTGLAVVTVVQGLIPPQLAVWIVAGANLGTTSTALLASSAMDALSRRLALMNTLFNVFVVLVFATILQPAISYILHSDLSLGHQIAMVHTLLNVVSVFLVFLMIPWLWPKIEKRFRLVEFA